MNGKVKVMTSSTENSESVAAGQDGRQQTPALAQTVAPAVAPTVEPAVEPPVATAPRATRDRPGAPEPQIESLDDAPLERFVRENGVDAVLVHPGAPTPSVADAARALGVPTDVIIKSLVFEVGGEPYLVIAAGEQRIAYKQLAAALGTSRKQVRMATPAYVLSVTGFPIGGMPPFGHARRLRTLVDSLSVRRGTTVYGGGGTDSSLMRVAVDTILDLTEARFLPLTQQASAPTLEVASS